MKTDFGCMAQPISMFMLVNIEFGFIAQPISMFIGVNIEFGCVRRTSRSGSGPSPRGERRAQFASRILARSGKMRLNRYGQTCDVDCAGATDCGADCTEGGECAAFNCEAGACIVHCQHESKEGIEGGGTVTCD